jgi:peroxiredoxin
MKESSKNIIKNVLIIYLSVICMVLAYLYRRTLDERNKLHFILYTPTEAYSPQQKLDMFYQLPLKDAETGADAVLGGLFELDRMVVCVFSTDCYSCDLASDVWNDVFDAYGGRFTVVGVSKDDAHAVKEYVKRNQVKFPVFHYDEKVDIEIFTSLPQTLVLEKNNGIILDEKGIPTKLINKLHTNKGGN